ncbi:hypothetical protein TorRG33x02_228390 [Trema orientale]|uniref:Late embryogenesis abundant protein n=1 Tax=Trema orientale TaxID=63057 RepID=A0A2P5E6Y7_TREOI|nr:hypothetical protein TorRG33x02_228390 [Trema orientale]
MESGGHDHEEQEVVVFHSSYPCAYYVQSPSTVSRANSADLIRNTTINDSAAFHESGHYFSSHHNKNISYDARSHETAASAENVENRLIIVDTTSTLDQHDHDDDYDNDGDDDDDDDHYYGRKRRGWFKRYCSYRNSDSSVWICIQLSWRFVVSLGVALLVFYVASRPPPPKLSIQMGRIEEFGLGEGVDGSGVTTKILTCKCSLNLIIENKSKLFGLHIHPPTMEMSFQRLTFALAHGPKMYAESGSTSFPLYIGTRNKPLYGAGRDMEDMLESGKGMPLVIHVRLSSSFRVVPSLIKPKYHHQAQCLLVLRRAYDKKHRTQLYNSTCTIT